MSRQRALLNRLALSGFLLAVPLSSAVAQDATAVGERLKSVLSKQGTSIDWTKISGDASKMVIEGAKLSVAPEQTTLALGDITLTDIKEQNGGYTVGTVSLPNYSVAEDGLSVDISGIAITNLRLPPENASDPVASLLIYDEADMQRAAVKVGDKQAFAIDGVHIEADAPVDGEPMTFSGAAEKISADLSLVEDPTSRELIEALDLLTVNGTLQLAGYWQPTDGRLVFDQYDISIEKAGTLGLTFDFGGYTPDFIESVQELQKAMADTPEGEENSAQNLAMLGLMQQLTFHSLSLRFDDDSLTGKVLDYVARQQKVKPADVVNQAKGLLPFLLAQLDAPDLMTQATAAVGAYLDNPKSIEIAARPENPVPFAMLMASAMSQPKDLVKTLAVSVTANEAATADKEE